MQKIKSTLITIIGFGCIAIGLIFILLPGPAVIFIPTGLAILSLRYQWAKKCLKTSQRLMRKNAQKMDAWLLKRKYR